MNKIPPKKSKRGRNFLIIALFFLGLAAMTAVLAPRFLAQEATRAPEQAGTFVTRQIDQAPLQFNLQDAIAQPADHLPDQADQQPNQVLSPEQQATHPDTENLMVASNPEGVFVASNPDSFDSESTESNAISEAHPVADQSSDLSTDADAMVAREAKPSETKAGMLNKPRQSPVRTSGQPFDVQISENQISSLIYTGLSQGIAPQYRQSLQGVSTQIQGGRATISIALLPKYLPEEFLRNLPGVNRQTPTIYMGGEVSLIQQGNSVQPVIHSVNLGAIRLPMPFLQSAMQSQVQAYIRQMMTLPDGRLAQLQKLQVQSGAIHLSGVVN